MQISYNEALKEIRKSARENGLVFKRKNATLNGAYLWRFVDKRRNDIAMDNVQFWTAYENVCSGFIDTFNQETGYFDGM